MNYPDNVMVLTAVQLAVGLAECEVEKLIEYQDETHARLTSKGLDYAMGLRRRLTPKDLIILGLFFNVLTEVKHDDETAT